MTLTVLRYILTLAQENHFGKAAKRCHVSQPTLSVAISKLEAQLGVALFERDKNKIRITETGKAIVAQAQSVLDGVDKLKDIAAGGKSQLNEPLKIGAIYTIGPYLFPHLVPRLQKTAPDMPLLVQEDFTENLRLKLQIGELDAAFISLPFTETGILTQELYDEPFVILMRKDHHLSKLNKIKPSDLPAHEMLLLGEGHCFRDQVLEVCPHCYEAGPLKNKNTQGTSLETLRHMVASGMGITILPSSATQIQFYKSILITKVFASNTPQRRVALAWRASFTRPKAIGVLIQALQQAKFNNICLLPDQV